MPHDRRQDDILIVAVGFLVEMLGTMAFRCALHVQHTSRVPFVVERYTGGYLICLEVACSFMHFCRNPPPLCCARASKHTLIFACDTSVATATSLQCTNWGIQKFARLQQSLTQNWRISETCISCALGPQFDIKPVLAKE